MIDFPQLLLNFSKVFRIAPNLSFFQRSVFLSTLSKDISENRNFNLFLDMTLQQKNLNVRSFLRVKARF